MKGYTPAHASVSTKSKFHENRKLDTVECLVLASDYAADNSHVQAGEPFYGDMPWLPEEIIPGFRTTCETYMNTVTALGKKLLPVWALSLDLGEDYFGPLFEDNYTYFRVAKYPPKPDLEPGEMDVNAHADTGFMTFLPPANEEGLQVLDTDGTWFWPELPANALIVNAGQFLERWANDRFRATPHRVIPPVHNDRYSLACFVNPSFEAVSECLPTCRTRKSANVPDPDISRVLLLVHGQRLHSLRQVQSRGRQGGQRLASAVAKRNSRWPVANSLCKVTELDPNTGLHEYQRIGDCKRFDYQHDVGVRRVAHPRSYGGVQEVLEFSKKREKYIMVDQSSVGRLLPQSQAAIRTFVFSISIGCSAPGFLDTSLSHAAGLIEIAACHA